MSVIKINFILYGEIHKTCYCPFIPRVNEFVSFGDQKYTVISVEYKIVVNELSPAKESFIDIKIV